MSTATLPTGTVTFLFTDIEGSTRLLQQLGEKFAGLDGKTHEVDETTCVIADDRAVLGFGGILGGEPHRQEAAIRGRRRQGRPSVRTSRARATACPARRP